MLGIIKIRRGRDLPTHQKAHWKPTYLPKRVKSKLPAKPIRQTSSSSIIYHITPNASDQIISTSLANPTASISQPEPEYTTPSCKQLTHSTDPWATTHQPPTHPRRPTNHPNVPPVITPTSYSPKLNERRGRMSENAPFVLPICLLVKREMGRNHIRMEQLRMMDQVQIV